MVTGYSVRLRRSYELQAGCRHYLLSDSRLDLFTICSIAAFIECRIRECASQRAVWCTTPPDVREELRYASWPSFLLLRFSLSRRCTLRPELRQRCNRLRGRSTRRDLFIGLNGRNRDSHERGLCWLQSINRPARLLGPECFRPPATNNSMARLSKRIRSGVSNQAQDLK